MILQNDLKPEMELIRIMLVYSVPTALFTLVGRLLYTTLLVIAIVQQ